jgi:hypothetical protein
VNICGQHFTDTRTAEQKEGENGLWAFASEMDDRDTDWCILVVWRYANRKYLRAAARHACTTSPGFSLALVRPIIPEAVTSPERDATAKHAERAGRCLRTRPRPQTGARKQRTGWTGMAGRGGASGCQSNGLFTSQAPSSKGYRPPLFDSCIQIQLPDRHCHFGNHHSVFVCVSQLVYNATSVTLALHDLHVAVLRSAVF